MRSRRYYKSQTRFDRTLGGKLCDGKSVTEDPQLIVEIIDNQRELDESLRQGTLEDGINWILGFNSYVKDKKGALSQRYPNSHIFKRGDIVLVDFFGHFGTELTYEHPALVLGDTFDGVIVAPISSTCYKDGENTHVDLDKNVPDQGNVVNNCGIKLEQLRFISKKRILKKFNRVSSSDKLDEIDDVIMKALAPFSYNFLLNQQDTLLEELANKNDELDIKEKEILELQRRIQLLEQEVEKVKSKEEDVS